jgi:hypothetical protein
VGEAQVDLFRPEEFVGGTPTDAVETTALPGGLPMVGEKKRPAGAPAATCEAHVLPGEGNIFCLIRRDGFRTGRGGG